MIREGDLLWTPDAARIERAQLTRFMRWLARERGRRFDDYASLWRWSVQDLEGFWSALWEYFGIRASVPPARALGRRTMPGAEWFPGARLNYAENVLRHERPGARGAGLSERGPARRPACPGTSSRARVRRLATALARAGHRQGRPRRRLSAEHARSHRRDARDGQHRRDLVELRSGFRRARRARSILAARAEADVLRRRLSATAASRSTGAPRSARSSTGCRRSRTWSTAVPRSGRPAAAARRARCSGTSSLPAPTPGTQTIPVRAGAVRASAVDPVLVGNDRACRSRSSIATAASRSSR